MRQDFTVLTELCKEKNIPFRIIHDSGNIVEIKYRSRLLIYNGSNSF